MRLNQFESLGIPWSSYITQLPTNKQLAFLMLPHREALYGGAAGGGKSSALLMAALQYADVPGYAAIIFRKTLTDLKQPDALIDRSHQWLQGTPAKWVGSEHAWYFPTVDHEGNPAEPSKLAFGYIGESNAYTRYQGIMIQTCCFDEVNQQEYNDYRYLFSRLRKLACPIHQTVNGIPNYQDDCPICQRQKSIPLRMRSTTNPGGFPWVKQRFRIQPDIDPREAVRTGAKVSYVGKHANRPFIPSFLADNPHLDQESYAASLDELDPVTRAMLKEGRWDVSPDARFKRHWARYYSRRGEYFTLGLNGAGPMHHMDSLQRIFVTVDPATSSKFGPGDILNWRKQPSYTVISIWALTLNYHLLWLDMVRFRREAPDVILAMKNINRRWKPDYFLVEGNGVGMPILQAAAREGLTVQPIITRVDKVTNATEAMIRMSQGRIWFPEEASWLSTAEDEIFFWTGAPTETDDIVDTLSNAARNISWDEGAVMPDNPENPDGPIPENTDLPSIIDDLYSNRYDNENPFGSYV